jgi:polysaccharide pyruvyl transferase WcaK-like protein
MEKDKTTGNAMRPLTTRPKHIAIWGGWYGSYNVGDQVLLLTITDVLTRTLGDAEFTVFTDNPDHVRTYTRLESNCSIEALHNRRQFPRVVQTLASCDLFIFGGGVPFYEERSHLLAMAILVGLARIFRTPYMMWTVSSQVVQDRQAMRLFRWVLEGAKAITYRDQHTRELFESCGVKRPMYLTADPGFWLEPREEEQAKKMIKKYGPRDETKPLVALTPRTLRSRDGDAETHYNVKTAVQFNQEINCFVAALDWLYEKGFQPIFVPMNTIAPDDDRIAAHIAIERAKYGRHSLLIDEKISPRAAPVIYRQCQLSFVARVHGGITSMIGHCPVMMYAFAPKHVGIMRAMGLERFSLPESEASPARTIEMISDLVENREQLRISIQERLELLRQEALIPARFVAQILGIRDSLWD